MTSDPKAILPLPTGAPSLTFAPTNSPGLDCSAPVTAVATLPLAVVPIICAVGLATETLVVIVVDIVVAGAVAAVVVAV